MTTPISEVGNNQIFPMLKALEREGADEDFVKWLLRKENAEYLFKMYKRFSKTKERYEIVMVPDVPVEELERRVVEKFPIVENGFKENLIRDEKGLFRQAGDEMNRGETFRVLIWSPDPDMEIAADYYGWNHLDLQDGWDHALSSRGAQYRYSSVPEVQEYLESRGYFGLYSPFLAWALQQDPKEADDFVSFVTGIYYHPMLLTGQFFIDDSGVQFEGWNIVAFQRVGK